MDLGLQGKKVLVTGGSKGLGLGLVRGFLEEGCEVAFCARDSDAFRALDDTLAAYSGRWYGHVTDVKQEQDLERFVSAAHEQMGGIDIVINNAGGIERFAPFQELRSEDWNDSWNLNFMSAVHTTRFAYPYLKNSNSPRVINISSITAVQAGTFNPHYSAAKAALINLGKHLSNLWVSEQILVNTIVPGNFRSFGWDSLVDEFAESHGISKAEARQDQEARVEQSIPLGRMGDVTEIVPLLLLVASERSTWMTGSCLVIDGGKVRAVH